MSGRIGVDTDLSSRPQQIIRTTGLTLLTALVGAIGLLSFAPTDTPLRGFGHGALSAVCWLYLFWGITALAFVALRWRSLGKGFWFLFAINMCVVAMIIEDFVANT